MKTDRKKQSQRVKEWWTKMIPFKMSAEAALELKLGFRQWNKRFFALSKIYHRRYCCCYNHQDKSGKESLSFKNLMSVLVSVAAVA